MFVAKTRRSAFIPGTCNIDALLKARGIDKLIATGTTTNICCESTMRGAMQMGYKVWFVQDGNATRDDAVHNASLLNILFFGDVVIGEEAIARIEAGLRPENPKNGGLAFEFFAVYSLECRDYPSESKSHGNHNYLLSK